MKKFIKSNIKNKMHGFSLLEIMFYIVIIAGLLVGVMQIYRKVTRSSKEAAIKGLLRMVKTGIDSFKVDIGRYPKNIEELVNPPSNAEERKRWQGSNGGYVPEKSIVNGTVVDEYGNPLEYKFDQSKNSYDLFSWGHEQVGADVGHLYAD
jgi:general secretion pathway protein G